MFRQTVGYGFTLKLVCDIIITFTQMHRTDKYPQCSSINWPVGLNGVCLQTKWLWVRIQLLSLILYTYWM